MGSIAQKILTLLQGFVDQAELTELEVTQPAMDETAGPARGAVAQITLLDQAGADAPERGIPRNAGAVDAAADDDQIENGDMPNFQLPQLPGNLVGVEIRHVPIFRYGRVWPVPWTTYL